MSFFVLSRQRPCSYVRLYVWCNIHPFRAAAFYLYNAEFVFYWFSHVNVCLNQGFVFTYPSFNAKFTMISALKRRRSFIQRCFKHRIRLNCRACVSTRAFFKKRFAGNFFTVKVHEGLVEAGPFSLQRNFRVVLFPKAAKESHNREFVLDKIEACLPVIRKNGDRTRFCQ